jgi:hypothetical protein
LTHKDEYTDGTFWRNHLNAYHRLDGPAIEYSNGDNEWWMDGKLHREDGPAIDWHHQKEWIINDQRHRLDGPAVINKIHEVREWWINDYEVTDEIHKWAEERNIDLENLSELDKAVIVLEWSNYSG